MIKQFGGKISDDLLKKYGKSPNWKNGIFVNYEETSMSFNWRAMPKFFNKQFIDNKGRSPEKALPIEVFDHEAFLKPSEEIKIIWFGHSVLLMRVNNKTILIDPMFGPNAAPIAPFNINRFSKNTLALIDELPPIDLMLLSHDHYDHLDLRSMEKLIPKVKAYYVALGCARHLIQWGVPPTLVHEFDWWEQEVFEGTTITFTPSRHFSGRGLTDRTKSLWAGWAFKTPKENIYFSGGSGYGAHFKEVGERLGPFDFGIMECGQYNENWHQIHMYPEEAIQAAIDAGIKIVMAVHWGAFPLAQHPWKEPIERFISAAVSQDVTVYTPKLGELFALSTPKKSMWWKEFE